MHIEFVATEVGFADGLGGASNAADGVEYHYVLFGKQYDEQQPSNSGVYFEFDDQIHGSVNKVKGIAIADGELTFILDDADTILVRRATDETTWGYFLQGIRETFDAAIVTRI